MLITNRWSRLGLLSRSSQVVFSLGPHHGIFWDMLYVLSRMENGRWWQEGMEERVYMVLGCLRLSQWYFLLSKPHVSGGLLPLLLQEVFEEAMWDFIKKKLPPTTQAEKMFERIVVEPCARTETTNKAIIQPLWLDGRGLSLLIHIPAGSITRHDRLTYKESLMELYAEEKSLCEAIRCSVAAPCRCNAHGFRRTFLVLKRRSRALSSFGRVEGVGSGNMENQACHSKFRHPC